MADVSYESLQSQIQEQQTQITSQRTIIREQKIAGERGIESLRRVHPRTKPGIYFGQIKPRIEQVKGHLVELKKHEVTLSEAEQKLIEQETLLAERKAEGWKIRKKDGEYEFYKVTQVPSVGVGRPRGDFSIRITWRDYRNVPEGEIKTVLGRASNLASMRQQISDRGGQILEVESLGGGRWLRDDPAFTTRTTTGGSFIFAEAPLIIKEPIKTAKEIERYIGIYEAAPPVLKRVLPTPERFAVSRGLPSDVFKEYVAAREVTTTTRTFTQTEIDKLLAGKTKEEKLVWYKENVRFGEEKQTWAEIKREQPDWALKVKAGKVVIATPETDREQLLKVMGEKYGELPVPARVVRAGAISYLSLFRPETWIAAFMRGGGPLTGGILGVQPRIGYEAAVSTLEWEYPITKIEKPLEKWMAVQRPAYEHVIIPFVAGAGLGIAFKGIGLAAKTATGVTAKVLTKFATKVPYVYGGIIAGMVGADIGYTAAMEEYGMVKPDTTLAKIFGYGAQFTFAIAGARWATAPRQPVLKKEFLMRYEKGEITAVAQRKYIDFLGKPRYYGKPKVGVKPDPLFVKTFDPYLAYAKVTRYGVAGVTPTVAGEPPGIGTALAVRPTGVLVPRVVPDIVRYDPFKPITGRIDYGVKPLERIELERVDWRIQERIDRLIGQERETYLEKQYEETMRRAAEKLGITFRPPKPKVDVLKIEKLDPYLAYARVTRYGVVGVTPTVVGKPPVPTALILRPTAMIVPRTFKDILLYDPFKPITGRIDYGLKPLEMEFDGIRKRLKARDIREFYERQDELREIRYEETLKKAAEKLEFVFKPKPLKVKTLRVDVLDPYLGYAKVSKYGVTGVTPTVVGKPPVPGIGVYTGRQPILRPISALTLWDWLTYTVKPEVVKEPLFRIFPRIMKPLKYTLKDIIKEPKIEPGVTVTKDGQILIQKKVVEARPIFRKKLVRPERVFDPYDVYGETEFVRNEIIESFTKLTGKPVGPTVMQRDMLLMFPVLKAAPMVKEAKIPRTMVDIGRDIRQMQLQFPVTKVERSLLFDTLQTQYQTQIQEQAQMQMQEFATATIQEQMQFQSQAQMLDVKSMRKLFQEQVTVTKKIIKPVPFILPDTPYKLFGHTLGQGYNVKIKERHIVKGKKIKEPRFIRVNKHPLSREDAQSLMGMVLDNSAAASGKIIPVNAMAQEPLIKLKPFENIEHKFYTKDDIIIEKTKYRIDTKGEVAGIPARAWYAERTEKAAKKKPVRRPRAKVMRERDMFDFGMDDMLINMGDILPRIEKFMGFQRQP